MAGIIRGVRASGKGAGKASRKAIEEAEKNAAIANSTRRRAELSADSTARKEATDLGAPASTSRSGDMETKSNAVEKGERVKKNNRMNSAYKDAVEAAKNAENKARMAKLNNDPKAQAKFEEQATLATNKAKDLRKKFAITEPVKGYKCGGYVAGGPNRMKKTGHTDSRSGITKKK